MRPRWSLYHWEGKGTTSETWNCLPSSLMCTLPCQNRPLCRHPPCQRHDIFHAKSGPFADEMRLSFVAAQQTVHTAHAELLLSEGMPCEPLVVSVFNMLPSKPFTCKNHTCGQIISFRPCDVRQRTHCRDTKKVVTLQTTLRSVTMSQSVHATQVGRALSGECGLLCVKIIQGTIWRLQRWKQIQSFRTRDRVRPML